MLKYLFTLKKGYVKNKPYCHVYYVSLPWNFESALYIFTLILWNKKSNYKIQKSHLPVLLTCINALQHTLYMFSESKEHNDAKTFKEKEIMYLKQYLTCFKIFMC